MTYTWDANKNKTSESITGVMSGYGFTAAGTTYDFEDRLTGFSRAATSGPASLSQSWNLTAVGDWTSVTTNGTAQNRTHGPTHELLTAGGQNVATDVKGNITTLPANLRPSGSTTAMNLTWDSDNKLRSADIDANGTADVNFQYDALGRRVARTGTGGSVVYVQMDQQTIADYPVGGAATTPTFRYVYASYIDEPVVRKTAGTGGTLVYFHRNHQYSITAITTSTGAISERYAYTAYGQPTILNASGTPLSPQTSTLNSRYSYTGREWDATLGLHHFRARWMSPIAGRFLGRDPIGYEGSEWGLYEYLRAGVTVGMDPMGLEGFPYIRKCGDKLIHTYPGQKEEDCQCVQGPAPPKKNPPKVGVTIAVPLGAAREVGCGESTKSPVTIDLVAEAQAAIGIPPFVVTVKGSVKASQTFSLDCELPECPKKCCDGPPPCDGVKKCQLVAYFRVLAVGNNIILLDVPTVKTVTCMTGTCDCSTKGGPWSPFGPNHPLHPNNQP